MKSFVLVGLSTVALGAAVALLPGNAFAQSTTGLGAPLISPTWDQQRQIPLPVKRPRHPSTPTPASAYPVKEGLYFYSQATKIGAN